MAMYSINKTDGSGQVLGRVMIDLRKIAYLQEAGGLTEVHFATPSMAMYTDTPMRELAQWINSTTT